MPRRFRKLHQYKTQTKSYLLSTRLHAHANGNVISFGRAIDTQDAQLRRMCER
ncbi:hypothetical protein PROFUN_08501 [Planoprotostelium fungivorum]|uniref:Uncharacterized protein n=1 Tax=Planoprotostelium fungivorum TaxID=1890364 RepID=A0A2P6NJD4_9EUKA|nr:hypothetical protein PROFUN_08501 [Planoprotostelium fungivorum]